MQALGALPPGTNTTSAEAAGYSRRAYEVTDQGRQLEMMQSCEQEQWPSKLGRRCRISAGNYSESKHALAALAQLSEDPWAVRPSSPESSALANPGSSAHGETRTSG
jgi:hypothetical protein